MRRGWHPTPALLPGESHGQRSLEGYSPRGRRESDTTEQLALSKLIHSRKTNTILESHYAPVRNRSRIFTGRTEAEAEFEQVLVSAVQSCPTLCDPMDYSPPGSSVRGILQARILEWVVMPSSRGSSPKD